MVSGQQHSLETGESHQSWYLTRNDVDSRSRHEPAHGRRRDKLNDPTQTQKSDSKYDESASEGNCCCNLWTIPYARMGVVDVLDDLRYGQGHDSNRPDRHVFGSSEELARSEYS